MRANPLYCQIEGLVRLHSHQIWHLQRFRLIFNETPGPITTFTPGLFSTLRWARLPPPLHNSACFYWSVGFGVESVYFVHVCHKKDIHVLPEIKCAWKPNCMAHLLMMIVSTMKYRATTLKYKPLTVLDGSLLPSSPCQRTSHNA